MINFATIVFFSCLLGTFFLISHADTQTNDDCKDNAYKSSEARLKEHLLCNYVWARRPNLDNKDQMTEVSLEFQPKVGHLIEHWSFLELYTWMLISWKDEHLMWDPDLYDDVDSLIFQSSEIWLPDIAVHGLHDQGENELVYDACETESDGMVTCTLRIHSGITCHTDITLWPYDRPNCTLVISSWTHRGERLAFTPESKSYQTVFMDDFVFNGDWDITVSRVAYERIKSNHFENTTSPKLSIDFILDRLHNKLSGRYLAPCMIMMVMTLTTVWLDARSKERLAVACLNPIIHLLCIQNISDFLPRNGNTLPNIVLFYTNSSVLATIALLLTLLLGKLHETRRTAPKWISTLIKSILRSKIGQNLLISMLDPSVSVENERADDDNGDFVSYESEESTWCYVVAFLGWITFLSYVFTYAIMWIIIVPNSSMRTPIVGVTNI